jgi:hypothetical protein
MSAFRLQASVAKRRFSERACLRWQRLENVALIVSGSRGSVKMIVVLGKKNGTGRGGQLDFLLLAFVLSFITFKSRV